METSCHFIEEKTFKKSKNDPDNKKDNENSKKGFRIVEYCFQSLVMLKRVYSYKLKQKYSIHHSHYLQHQVVIYQTMKVNIYLPCLFHKTTTTTYYRKN